MIEPCRNYRSELEAPWYTLTLSQTGVRMADARYEKLKNMSDEVVQRYFNRMSFKKGFSERIESVYNEQRRASLAAVRRVIAERKSLEAIN